MKYHKGIVLYYHSAVFVFTSLYKSTSSLNVIDIFRGDNLITTSFYLRKNSALNYRIMDIELLKLFLRIQRNFNKR